MTDAFTIAIQIPTILFSLISTAISNVVLPYYSKELFGKSKAAADKYVSNLMTVISVITIGVVLLCEFGAKYIVLFFAPGLKSNTLIVATTLFRIVLPTILMTELMNINTAIINVHKSFVLPSLMSIVLNVTYVSFIAVFVDAFGIYAAVLGMVIGTCAEFLYSVILRRKYMKYRFQCDFKDRNMIASAKKAIPIFVGIGAAEINKLIDAMVSSFLTAGSISILNYASKLTSAISMLFVHGITTVVYPEFAESAAKKDERQMANNYQFALMLILAIMTPVVYGGISLAEEFITVVFKRGAFDAIAVKRTTPLFSCYLICLVFTAIRQVASRMFYSYGDTKTPMRNSIIGIIINIVLDVILAKFIGALGLALATTIATMIISVLLMKDAKKKNNLVEYKKTYLLFCKINIACIVMSFSIVQVLEILQKLNIYNAENFVMTVLVIVICIFVGIGVYVLMLIMMRTQEIREFVKILKRR